MAIDFASVSEHSREELSSIASMTYYDDIDISEKFLEEQVIWFFLTLQGTRPASEIASYFEQEDYTAGFNVYRDPFLGLLDELPIAYNFSIKRYWDDSQGAWVRWFNRTVYTDGNYYEPDSNCGDAEFNRTWGDIFGYPDWVIRAFNQNDTVTSTNIIRSERNVSLDEAVYLTLVPFTIPETEERIEDSIQLGQEYEQNLLELSETVPYLSDVMKWRDSLRERVRNYYSESL